jgi:hypothetical protein
LGPSLLLPDTPGMIIVADIAFVSAAIPEQHIVAIVNRLRLILWEIQSDVICSMQSIDSELYLYNHIDVSIKDVYLW